jgi:hypothetical protein
MYTCLSLAAAVLPCKLDAERENGSFCDLML